MRSHALGTPCRSCARGVFCGPAFPLAHPLPSIPSASGLSPSPGPLGAPWPFPAFPPSCPFRSARGPCSGSIALCSGTSSVLRGSQTPCSVHRWIASSDFPPRPAVPSPRAGAGSPGSRAWRFHACSGSRRRPRQVPLYLAILGAADVAFSSGNSLGTWKLTLFRGSIPGLRVPLSTLRAYPYGRVHMTRGHREWRALQCANSSFATPCRFIPALLPGRVARINVSPNDELRAPPVPIAIVGRPLKAEGVWKS